LRLPYRKVEIHPTTGPDQGSRDLARTAGGRPRPAVTPTLEQKYQSAGTSTDETSSDRPFAGWSGPEDPRSARRADPVSRRRRALFLRSYGTAEQARHCRHAAPRPGSARRRARIRCLRRRSGTQATAGASEDPRTRRESVRRLCRHTFGHAPRGRLGAIGPRVQPRPSLHARALLAESSSVRNTAAPGPVTAPPHRNQAAPRIRVRQTRRRPHITAPGTTTSRTATSRGAAPTSHSPPPRR